MAIAQFVHDGQAIDYTPGANVTAGDVIVQGDLVGVAKLDIPTGRLGALAVEGVFDVFKAANVGITFEAGDPVYWNNVATAEAAMDSNGGAYKLLGKAVRAAADADTTVRVRLCPCAIPPDAPSSSGS